MRNHFNFHVRRRQRHLAAFDLNEQVAQNGQGMPAFNDIDHLGQCFQKNFALETKSHRAILQWVQ